MQRSMIEEIIKSQQQPYQCFICDAKLTHPNIAEAHYRSNRHRGNVVVLRQELLENARTVRNKAKRMVEPVWINCLICDVLITEDAADEHYNGQEHKKKEEAYCDICLLVTMSKEQLWEHMNGSKHKEKLKALGLPPIDVQCGPFDLTLPRNVKNMMLPDICQVCNKIFPTMNHALDHYLAPQHQVSVRRWFKENKKLGSNKRTTVLTKNNQKLTNNTYKITQHHGDSSTSKKSSESGMFEIHNNTGFMMENRKGSLEALGNENAQSSQSMPIIPPSYGDYTKNDELQKNDEVDAQKSNVPPFGNVEPTNFENKSFTPAGSLGDVNSESRDTKNKTDNDRHINDKTLKEQVFQEIDKLVKTLYFSRTVPYNIALEYLKKVNNEVEVLREKYGKKEEQERPEMTGESAASTSGLYDNVTAVESVKPNVTDVMNDKDVSTEDEFYSFTSNSNNPQETEAFDLINFSDDLTIAHSNVVKNVPQEIQGITDLIDFCEGITNLDFNNDVEINSENFDLNKDPYMSDEEKLSDSLREEMINIQQKYKEQVDQDMVRKENSPSPGDKGSLQTMHEEIILIRGQIEEKYPNEENVEKEVLTEIERLIKLVHSGDIPLDVTLTCLQNFNEELDLQDFSQQAVNEQEAETEANGECETVQDKQLTKYRYSKEELLALRMEGTFTDKLSNELSTSINNSRIWNKRWNDLDLD